MVDYTDWSPEVTEAIRRQHEMDRADAGPKAPVSSFRYRGVQIESRWAVLAELETMRRIIDAMPELMARRLEAIWCDSNAGSCYTFSVRSNLWVPELRWAISDAVIEANGGHNGIMIEAGGGNGCDIDPNWGEAF
ncbi:hypothetical protein [Ruegeria atlantica]|uniref:hypothetical protein n=1 Tax=Ruegeria atlantica TaxID=81569 RepID=UPI0014813BE6|nr:hypothetical protein [Ruegeria atlantica]